MNFSHYILGAKAISIRKHVLFLERAWEEWVLCWPVHSQWQILIHSPDASTMAYPCPWSSIGNRSLLLLSQAALLHVLCLSVQTFISLSTWFLELSGPLLAPFFSQHSYTFLLFLKQRKGRQTWGLFQSTNPEGNRSFQIKYCINMNNIYSWPPTMHISILQSAK